MLPRPESERHHLGLLASGGEKEEGDCGVEVGEEEAAFGEEGVQGSASCCASWSAEEAAMATSPSSSSSGVEQVPLAFACRLPR